MRCEWEDYDERDERGWRRVKCKRCGQITGRTPHPFDRINATCRVPGWGDWLAHFLATWTGITKERYTHWLRVLRIIEPSKVCPCGSRQEALNKTGQSVEWFIRQFFEKAGSFFRKREPPSA